MLIGILIYLLVLLLVLAVIDYAARLFLTDNKLLQLVRLILGLIFLIALIYVLLPLAGTRVP
jgi:hypothetical protein